jgi:hypothetical protein
MIRPPDTNSINPATAIDKLYADLEALKKLEPGWDSYKAVPIKLHFPGLDPFRCSACRSHQSSWAGPHSSRRIPKASSAVE